MNVLISLQISNNDVEFSEILSKNVVRNKVDYLTTKLPRKVSRNTVDILTKEITSIKVRGNKVDFCTIEITSKKVPGNDKDFSTIEIRPEKVCGNDMDVLISEITSKKYVETTWKFAEIWSSTYQRNIHVESMSNRHCVPVGKLLLLARKSKKMVLEMFFFKISSP